MSSISPATLSAHRDHATTPMIDHLESTAALTRPPVVSHAAGGGWFAASWAVLMIGGRGLAKLTGGRIDGQTHVRATVARNTKAKPRQAYTSPGQYARHRHRRMLRDAACGANGCKGRCDEPWPAWTTTSPSSERTTTALRTTINRKATGMEEHVRAIIGRPKKRRGLQATVARLVATGAGLVLIMAPGTDASGVAERTNLLVPAAIAMVTAAVGGFVGSPEVLTKTQAQNQLNIGILNIGGRMYRNKLEERGKAAASMVASGALDAIGLSETWVADRRSDAATTAIAQDTVGKVRAVIAAPNTEALSQPENNKCQGTALLTNERMARARVGQPTVLESGRMIETTYETVQGDRFTMWLPVYGVPGRKTTEDTRRANKLQHDTLMRRVQAARDRDEGIIVAGDLNCTHHPAQRGAEGFTEDYANNIAVSLVASGLRDVWQLMHGTDFPATNVQDGVSSHIDSVFVSERMLDLTQRDANEQPSIAIGVGRRKGDLSDTRRLVVVQLTLKAALTGDPTRPARDPMPSCRCTANAKHQAAYVAAMQQPGPGTPTDRLTRALARYRDEAMVEVMEPGAGVMWPEVARALNQIEASSTVLTSNNINKWRAAVDAKATWTAPRPADTQRAQALLTNVLGSRLERDVGPMRAKAKQRATALYNETLEVIHTAMEAARPPRAHTRVAPSRHLHTTTPAMEAAGWLANHADDLPPTNPKLLQGFVRRLEAMAVNWQTLPHAEWNAKQWSDWLKGAEGTVGAEQVIRNQVAGAAPQMKQRASRIDDAAEVSRAVGALYQVGNSKLQGLAVPTEVGGTTVRWETDPTKLHAHLARFQAEQSRNTSVGPGADPINSLLTEITCDKVDHWTDEDRYQLVTMETAKARWDELRPQLTRMAADLREHQTPATVGEAARWKYTPKVVLTPEEAAPQSASAVAATTAADQVWAETVTDEVNCTRVILDSYLEAYMEAVTPDVTVAQREAAQHGRAADRLAAEEMRLVAEEMAERWREMADGFSNAAEMMTTLQRMKTGRSCLGASVESVRHGGDAVLAVMVMLSRFDSAGDPLTIMKQGLSISATKNAENVRPITLQQVLHKICAARSAQVKVECLDKCLPLNTHGGLPNRNMHRSTQTDTFVMEHANAHGRIAVRSESDASGAFDRTSLIVMYLMYCAMSVPSYVAHQIVAATENHERAFLLEDELYGTRSMTMLRHGSAQGQGDSPPNYIVPNSVITRMMQHVKKAAGQLKGYIINRTVRSGECSADTRCPETVEVCDDYFIDDSKIITEPAANELTGQTADRRPLPPTGGGYTVRNGQVYSDTGMLTGHGTGESSTVAKPWDQPPRPGETLATPSPPCMEALQVNNVAMMFLGMPTNVKKMMFGATLDGEGQEYKPMCSDLITKNKQGHLVYGPVQRTPTVGDPDEGAPANGTSKQLGASMATSVPTGCGSIHHVEANQVRRGACAITRTLTAARAPTEVVVEASQALYYGKMNGRLMHAQLSRAAVEEVVDRPIAKAAWEALDLRSDGMTRADADLLFLPKAMGGLGVSSVGDAHAGSVVLNVASEIDDRSSTYRDALLMSLHDIEATGSSLLENDTDDRAWSESTQHRLQACAAAGLQLHRAGVGGAQDDETNERDACVALLSVDLPRVLVRALRADEVSSAGTVVMEPHNWLSGWTVSQCIALGSKLRRANRISFTKSVRVALYYAAGGGSANTIVVVRHDSAALAQDGATEYCDTTAQADREQAGVQDGTAARMMSMKDSEVLIRVAAIRGPPGAPGGEPASGCFSGTIDVTDLVATIQAARDRRAAVTKENVLDFLTDHQLRRLADEVTAANAQPGAPPKVQTYTDASVTHPDEQSAQYQASEQWLALHQRQGGWPAPDEDSAPVQRYMNRVSNVRQAVAANADNDQMVVIWVWWNATPTWPADWYLCGAAHAAGRTAGMHLHSLHLEDPPRQHVPASQYGTPGQTRSVTTRTADAVGKGRVTARRLTTVNGGATMWLDLAIGEESPVVWELASDDTQLSTVSEVQQGGVALTLPKHVKLREIVAGATREMGAWVAAMTELSFLRRCERAGIRSAITDSAMMRLRRMHDPTRKLGTPLEDDITPDVALMAAAWVEMAPTTKARCFPKMISPVCPCVLSTSNAIDVCPRVRNDGARVLGVDHAAIRAAKTDLEAEGPRATTMTAPTADGGYTCVCGARHRDRIAFQVHCATAVQDEVHVRALHQRSVTAGATVEYDETAHQVRQATTTTHRILGDRATSMAGETLQMLSAARATMVPGAMPDETSSSDSKSGQQSVLCRRAETNLARVYKRPDGGPVSAVAALDEDRWMHHKRTGAPPRERVFTPASHNSAIGQPRTAAYAFNENTDGRSKLAAAQMRECPEEYYAGQGVPWQHEVGALYVTRNGEPALGGMVAEVRQALNARRLDRAAQPVRRDGRLASERDAAQSHQVYAQMLAGDIDVEIMGNVWESLPGTAVDVVVRATLDRLPRQAQQLFKGRDRTTPAMRLMSAAMKVGGRGRNRCHHCGRDVTVAQRYRHYRWECIVTADVRRALQDRTAEIVVQMGPAFALDPDVAVDSCPAVAVARVVDKFATEVGGVRPPARAVGTGGNTMLHVQPAVGVDFKPHRIPAQRVAALELLVCAVQADDEAVRVNRTLLQVGDLLRATMCGVERSVARCLHPAMTAWFQKVYDLDVELGAIPTMVTAGVFARPAKLDPALCGVGLVPAGRTDDAAADWEEPGHALVVIGGSSDDVLTAAARATVRAVHGYRTVLVAELITAGGWHARNNALAAACATAATKEGAARNAGPVMTRVATFAAGEIVMGDAQGWGTPAATAALGAPRAVWTVDSATKAVKAPKGQSPATMQRTKAATNRRPVEVYVVQPASEAIDMPPSPVQLAALARIMAHTVPPSDTGCSRSYWRHAGTGRQTKLGLGDQTDRATAALLHRARRYLWQPAGEPEPSNQEQSPSGAVTTEVQATRTRVGDRWEDAVRDGAIPRSFVDAAMSNGATRASVQMAAAAIVGEQARAARRMEQAVADGDARLHDQLGLEQREGSTAGAQERYCEICGSPAHRFHRHQLQPVQTPADQYAEQQAMTTVTAATRLRHGDRSVEAVDMLNGLRGQLRKDGVYMCVMCAATMQSSAHARRRDGPKRAKSAAATPVKPKVQRTRSSEQPPPPPPPMEQRTDRHALKALLQAQCQAISGRDRPPITMEEQRVPRRCQSAVDMVEHGRRKAIATNEIMFVIAVDRDASRSADDTAFFCCQQGPDEECHCNQDDEVGPCPACRRVSCKVLREEWVPAPAEPKRKQTSAAEAQSARRARVQSGDRATVENGGAEGRRASAGPRSGSGKPRQGSRSPEKGNKYQRRRAATAAAAEAERDAATTDG